MYQKVYIVESGAFFDGSNVEGVYLSERKAKEIVRKKATNWRKAKDETYTEWVSPDGCEFVRISAKEII